LKIKIDLQNQFPIAQSTQGDFDLYLNGFNNCETIKYGKELSGQTAILKSLCEVSKNTNKPIITAFDTDNYGILKQSVGVFENGKLLMISEDDNEEEVVSLFVFNATDNTLYYGESTVQAGEVTVYKLAEYITDFTIEFVENVDDEVTKVTQADVIVKMDRNGKEYEGEMSVSLRNKPTIDNRSIGYSIER
jgi:hypothetical protein